MLNWEYVASAISYCGKLDHDYPHMQFMNDSLNRLNGLHNHNVSVLFNAYTERDHVPLMNALHGAHRIYSDSGGLQMVSLGIGQITEKAKQKVYKTQSEGSDVAMIFDSIPVVSNESATSKVLKNNASRLYDPSLLKPCAIETAQNINAQLDYFESVNSDTKVVCILQGNTPKDYQQWLNYILAELPKDRWDKISGVAFGSPAYGSGQLEDIEKAFFISQLDCPEHIKKHIHLLGVGSVNRLAPVMLFRSSGIIPSDTLISYDSSKHTGGIVRGQYQMEYTIASIPRDSRRGYDKLEKLVTSFCTHILKEEIDRSFMHDIIFMGMIGLTEKYGDSQEVRDSIIKYRFILLFFSIYNVTRVIDKAEKDIDYFANQINNPLLLPLLKVKTEDQFNSWKQSCGGNIPSDKVMTVSTKETNLEGFFG